MLEVCVDSLESAENAIHGSADELEICSSLTEGGLTPSVGLVKTVLRLVALQKPKMNVMLRCRTGSDFCYTEQEMNTMLADLDVFKQLGVDRFVFGALTDTQQIDEANCSKVIAQAHPIPVTFHRAFDVCKEPLVAIEKLINLGFDRVLTSGQRTTADHVEAIKLIKLLVETHGDKIQIMPGAGVNIANANMFINLGCNIIHSSCKMIRHLPKVEHTLSMGTNESEHIYITDENIVQKIKEVINC